MTESNDFGWVDTVDWWCLDGAPKEMAKSVAAKSKTDTKTPFAALVDRMYPAARSRLASDAGVSTATISDLCKRETFSLTPSLVKVCEAMGIDVNALVDDGEIKTKPKPPKTRSSIDLIRAAESLIGTDLEDTAAVVLTNLARGAKPKQR